MPTQYDHITFPGAVPRTFVGAIVLAAISYPASLVDRLLGLAHTSADIQLAGGCYPIFSWPILLGLTLS